MREKKRSLPYFLTAFATLFIGVVVLFAMAFYLIFTKSSQDTDRIAESEKIVERTLKTVGNKMDEKEKIFKKLIREDAISIPYFLQIQLTGTEYLFSAKSDRAFLKDLRDSLDVKDLPGEVGRDLNEQSRIYTLYSFAQEAGYKTPAINLIDKDAHTFFVSAEGDLTEDGYALGIREIKGHVTTDDVNYKGTLFVNEIVRYGFFSKSEDSVFSLFWDTRYEKAGEYGVHVLIRSADGRGKVITDEKAIIPELVPLENQSVQTDSLAKDKDRNWYILDAMDKNAYINLVGLSGDLSATLYDRFGNRIGKNDIPGTAEEILRGKRQDTLLPHENEGENVFYAKIERVPEESEAQEITYTLVQSKETAKGPDGEYLSIQKSDNQSATEVAADEAQNTGDGDSGSEEIYLCRNQNGEEKEYSASQLSFLPLNGYLQALSLKTGEDSGELTFFPLFSADDRDYAYVSKTDLSDIFISLVPMEGYASEIRYYVTGAAGEVWVPEKDLQDKSSPETAGDESRENNETDMQLPLFTSENEIRITLTDIDGEQSLYRIFFLSGMRDTGFEKEMMEPFPESYHNGLWLVHNLRPSWRFEPLETNLLWNDVMAAQDKDSFSLANRNSHPQWTKEESPLYDGDAWYAAKTHVVEYFLDPRNFLKPDNIFQFEKLIYDTSLHSKEGVLAVARKTFLVEDEIGYVDMLMNAGEQAGISPYFLTSRLIQEMGSQGQSLLAQGALPGYEGYYNFYNIGSTPDPTVENGALINGAKFAMWGSDPDKKEITPEEAALLLPWDSREKAITGGAKWIAERYIAVGQDTLYLQKFDVVENEDGLYHHQYAQNISMAYSEGKRYYQAYEAVNLLDSPFVFKIPIYIDMPERFGQWPA